MSRVVHGCTTARAGTLSLSSELSFIFDSNRCIQTFLCARRPDRVRQGFQKLFICLAMFPSSLDTPWMHLHTRRTPLVIHPNAREQCSVCRLLSRRLALNEASRFIGLASLDDES